MIFGDPNGWDTVDLSTVDTPLEAGDYNAAIVVDTISKPEVMWLKVSFTLIDHDDYVIPTTLLPIAAKPDTKHFNRVHEGRRLIVQLARAAGVALPSDLHPRDLPKLLNNKRVRVQCAVQMLDGFRELVVRKVMPIMDAVG